MASDLQAEFGTFLGTGDQREEVSAAIIALGGRRRKARVGSFAVKIGNVERDDLDGSALCARGLADDEVAYPDILLRRSRGSSDGNCEESSDGSEGVHLDVWWRRW